MTYRRTLLLLVIGLSFAGISKANNGKTDLPLLHGYVMDALTKKPVAGVIVSATSQGASISQEVTTDSEGYFHFAQLPSSSINLQFDKKGYQSYTRYGIMIKEKMTVKVKVEFLPDETERDSDESEYPLLKMLELN